MSLLLGTRIWQGKYLRSLHELLLAAKNMMGGMAVFCNAHMLVTSLEDRNLLCAMRRATWVFPDGRPVALGMRLKTGRPAEQVSGPAMMSATCRMAGERGWGVYLYGGSPEVLDELEAVLPERYPGLWVAGSCSPPFRCLSEDEEAAHCNSINASGARFCYVALGCPKQELWMARNVHRVKPVMLGVGAAFPMEAGVTPRAPEWLSRCYLEWAYRLCQEPERLWRRYAHTNRIYLNRLLRELITK